LGSELAYAKMAVALDVLEELGFIRHDVGYAIVPDAPRADLETSQILHRLRA
jgi:hypothetical protein